MGVTTGKRRLIRESTKKMKQGEVNATSKLRKHRVTEKLSRGYYLSVNGERLDFKRDFFFHLFSGILNKLAKLLIRKDTA